jgi:hypothetical protein
MTELTTVAELRSAIQTLISTSNPVVLDQVIETFVKQDRDRRAAMLIDGLKRHADADAALAKIKPDHVVFAEDGSPLQRGWTANRKGERDKAQKLLDKYANALNTAIATGEFKPLEEALKGGGGPKDEPKDDAS